MVNVATAGGAIDNWGEFAQQDYKSSQKVMTIMALFCKLKLVQISFLLFELVMEVMKMAC